MDVMEMRFRMMAMMGGQDMPKVATGEFDYTSGTQTITHNLHSKKCFAILQRINSDHSVVDTNNRYLAIALMTATVELINLDEEQGYSLNSGNIVRFNGAATTVSNYLRAQYAYFGAVDGTTPSFNAYSNPTQGIVATSNDVVTFPGVAFAPGRWVYTIIAI